MASGSNRHHSDHSESDEPEINLLSNRASRQKKNINLRRERRDRDVRKYGRNVSSSSEKEVNRNIDERKYSSASSSSKQEELDVAVCCTCIHDHNGEQIIVGRCCQDLTDIFNLNDGDENQKAKIEIGIQQPGQRKNNEETDKKIREGFEKLIHFIKSLK